MSYQATYPTSKVRTDTDLPHLTKGRIREKKQGNIQCPATSYPPFLNSSHGPFPAFPPSMLVRARKDVEAIGVSSEQPESVGNYPPLSAQAQSSSRYPPPFNVRDVASGRGDFFPPSPFPCCFFSSVRVFQCFSPAPVV